MNGDGRADTRHLTRRATADDGEADEKVRSSITAGRPSRRRGARRVDYRMMRRREPSDDRVEVVADANVPAERPQRRVSPVWKADSDELERQRLKKGSTAREGSAEWVLHSAGTEMTHNPPVCLLIAAINIS